jgi:ubiquitin C-terminal hydrolase
MSKDNKKNNHKYVSNTLPIGIPNSGNFCYIIASLQSLFNDNVINNYAYVNNNQIDDNILALYKLYELHNSLHTKEEVNVIITNKLRTILTNDEYFKSLLEKLQMNKGTFLKLTKKIKDNIYHLYIYIYFTKLMDYYKLTADTTTLNLKNNVDTDIKEQMQNTHKLIMEYIKLNNVVLGAMGIKELVDGQQHDAQEYILTILDILNDSHTFKLVDCLEPEIAKLTEKEMNKLTLDKRIIYGYKKAFAQYNKDGYTPLKTNLYFYTTQFIDCRNCKFKSISFQENSMLSIPIPDYNNEDENENITIYDCLDKYFGLEVMDYGYKCDECEERVENNILSKKILTTPKSFIIFLKRFNFNMKTMSMTKNHNMVMYPPILNISKYLIAKDEVANYKLKSVICHNGCMSYGHYYSYNCKSIDGNDRWFKCNDENINEIPIENFENVVISKQAYMLFYEKV